MEYLILIRGSTLSCRLYISSLALKLWDSRIGKRIWLLGRQRIQCVHIPPWIDPHSFLLLFKYYTTSGNTRPGNQADGGVGMHEYPPSKVILLMSFSLYFQFFSCSLLSFSPLYFPFDFFFFFAIAGIPPALQNVLGS